MPKHLDDDGPRPWDRQHGESAAAWAAFVAYRDEGPGRSLDKTGAKLGRTRNTVGLHSARWKWTARVAAYDAWLDRQGQDASADAVADMNRRHAQAAHTALAAITARLEALAPEELATRDIAALMKAAADLERRARGADGPALEDGALDGGRIPIREVVILRPSKRDDD